MSLSLRAEMIEMVADADPNTRWMSVWLDVVDPKAPSRGRRIHQCLPDFQMMCHALMSDVQNAEGSGKAALEQIQRIESGAEEKIESDGNGWVSYITKDKVRFEGLYEQGKGGEVSFAQYKRAVETYVRFLADPEHKPIEVEFPSA